MENVQKISISFGTLFKVLVFGLVVYVAYLARDIIGAVLVSVVLAAAIEPPVRALARYRVPRTLGVIFVYLLAFFTILLTVYSVAPQLGFELREFLSELPKYTANLETQIDSRFPILPDLFFDRLDELVSRVDIGIITTKFFEGAPAIIDRLFLLFIIFVLSFYLAVQHNGVAKFLRVIAPERYDDYIVNVWFRTQKKIERWLQGQLLLAAIVGAIVYVGLTLLGVEFALTLALISAVFELIPFFGPILASIPGIAIAAIQDPLLGLLVFFLYGAVQQLENHLIYPIVMRKMTGVPPLIAIIALLIGARMAGAMGIILAIPAVVVLMELLDDFDKQKHQQI